MDRIAQNLENWRSNLVESIPVPMLAARNPIAYKWLSMFRTWALREGLLWRMHDLMSQSHLLSSQGLGLGARVLLRSGVETVAVMIHLNQLMQKVIDGRLPFRGFSEKTQRLLFGCRNGTTGFEAINILSILEKADRKYPALRPIYDHLSESAHPNFDGLYAGYAKFDIETDTLNFSSKWVQEPGAPVLDMLDSCMEIFHIEYNDVWKSKIELLEQWVEANNATLEANLKNTQ